MSHVCKVKIKVITYETPETCPFMGTGIRELARATGLDVGFLSRVKNGRIPITHERLMQIRRLAKAGVLPRKEE